MGEGKERVGMRGQYGGGEGEGGNEGTIWGRGRRGWE